MTPGIIKVAYYGMLMLRSILHLLAALLLCAYVLVGALALELLLSVMLRVPFFESPIDAVYVMIGLAILVAIAIMIIADKRHRDED
jgi:hypothetical protein